jgi:hypothetical protein
MGGSSKGDTPEPPDPWETAEAQLSYNQRAAEMAARFNQMGVVSPYGSQYYTGEIGGPDRQLNIELSPAQQALLEQREGLSSDFLSAGAQLLPGVLNRLGADYDPGYENALYQRGLNRMRPEYERAEQRQHSRLLGQGMPIGSRGYGQEMDRQGQQYGDALENLSLSSQTAGLQEDRAQRNQAISELMGMLSGASIPGASGSPATSMPGQAQVGAPNFGNLAQNQYMGEMANYNAQANQLGGLYQLAGMGLGSMPWGDMFSGAGDMFGSMFGKGDTGTVIGGGGSGGAIWT